MPLSALKQFNWVDILILIIFFRIGYIALATGLPIEIFKFSGTIASIYLSLHYYTSLTDWFGERIPGIKERMPLEFLDFISFVLLVALGYLFFMLVRLAFYRFIKMEAAPRLNKWGGLVLGIARGIFLSSLIVFMLVISSIGYLKDSVGNSYSGRYFFATAETTYSALWNGLFSKFMGRERFNETTLEVQKDLMR